MSRLLRLPQLLIYRNVPAGTTLEMRSCRLNRRESTKPGDEARVQLTSQPWYLVASNR